MEVNCRFESRSSIEDNNAHFVRNPTTNETLFIALFDKLRVTSIPSASFRSQVLKRHHVRFLPDRVFEAVMLEKLQRGFDGYVKVINKTRPLGLAGHRGGVRKLPAASASLSYD